MSRCLRVALPVLFVTATLATTAAPLPPRIGSLPLGEGRVALDLRLAIVEENWSTVHYFDALPGLAATQQQGATIWQAPLAGLPAASIGFITERLSYQGDDLVVEVAFANPSSRPLVGVFLMLNVAAPDFAGGSFRLDATSGELPLIPAAEPHLRLTTASQATLWDYAAASGISLSSAAPLRMLVQDGRRWGPEFTLMATLHDGSPPPGETIQHRFLLSALGRKPQQRSGLVTLLPQEELGRFEGFGGNYCFRLEEEVVNHVERRLRPPVARLRMHLDDLQPPPPGSDPHAAWLRMLLAADRPWSELWHCLNRASQLHKRNARLHISTWRVPAWLLDRPLQHDQNQIPARHIETFAGMVAAYLDYLRQRYGVVPESFSFNEPDWGANVSFTPQEYHDTLLAVTRALRQRGIATRLLLGDLATMRQGSHSITNYLAPVLASHELRTAAAGLSVHAWGGAESGDYQAWRNAADQLGLPLVIGEIGSDPDWRNVRLHGYDYALRELALYFEVVAACAPQQVLYWEYGASYSLLPPLPGGGWARDSARLAMQWHWVALTPPGATQVAVKADDPALRSVAYYWRNSAGLPGLTLHLANFGPANTSRLTGLPAGLGSLRRYTTSEEQFAQRESDWQPATAATPITLPAQSFTTLTTY